MEGYYGIMLSNIAMAAGLAVFIIVASHLASRWAFEMLGRKAYILLLLPGVIVHELSHLAGCILTITPVRGFSLLPKEDGEGLILGSVTYRSTANPLKLLVISILPLFGGALALRYAAFLLLISPGSVDPLAGAAMLHQLSQYGIRGLIFAYCVVAVGAHISPSGHDLGYALKGLLGILGILGLLVYVGKSLSIPFLDTVISGAGLLAADILPLLRFSAVLIFGMLVVFAFLRFLRRR
jgi:hypothetical protein